MQGKTTLITGAGSGLGREISAAFAHAGSALVLADRDLVAAQVAAQELREACGVEAIAIAVDVADPSSVRELAAALEGRTIDALVNNAGLFDGFEPIETVSLELWSKVLGVNVNGPFLVTQGLLPALTRSNSPAVVNIASICGLVAGSGGSAYTASKHGLIGLTRQLAYELGPRGVRVNAICPGVIATGMSMPLLNDPSLSAHATQMVESVPSRRLGRPNEVGALAVFLAQDEAGYINGAAIPIDGGWTAV